MRQGMPMSSEVIGVAFWILLMGILIFPNGRLMMTVVGVILCVDAIRDYEDLDVLEQAM